MAKEKSPARQPDDGQPDFIQEVNEEMRQKQLEAFWLENRNWIIGGVIFAILTTAGITWWRTWSFNTNVAQTSQLLDIVERDDPKMLTDFAAESRKSQAAIARFLAAGLHVQKGEPEKAVEIYKEIAGTIGLDSTLRELARVLSLSHRLHTGDPKQLHQEIADLSGKDDPFRYTALELDALLYARQGDMKKAAEKLQTIAQSATAPEDERMRAMTLVEFYTASAEENAGKKKEAKK